MTTKILMAASCCLFASLPVFAQAQASGCGKPFTARAIGGSAGEKGADVACQGPMLRMVTPGQPGMMLIDGRANGRAFFVYDDTRDYYEVPVEKDADPSAFIPCRELASIKKDAPGATCRKAGSETVNGRRTDKWVTKGEGVDEVVEYYDPELNVPVKVTKGGYVESELKDIKVGSVSGSMSVPVGYRKLSEKEFTDRAIAATKKAMEKKKG